MLTLTRKTDYALVAVAALAAWMPRAASARDLADRLGIPPAMLRNILKDLATAGVLESVQGAHGGYRLARDPAEVFVGEVIRAIEGEPVLARCCAPDVDRGGEPVCPLESACRIKGAVRRLHLRVHELISSVTIHDLLEAESQDEGAMVGIAIDRAGEARSTRQSNRPGALGAQRA